MQSSLNCVRQCLAGANMIWFKFMEQLKKLLSSKLIWLPETMGETSFEGSRWKSFYLTTRTPAMWMFLVPRLRFPYSAWAIFDSWIHRWGWHYCMYRICKHSRLATSSVEVFQREKTINASSSKQLSRYECFDASFLLQSIDTWKFSLRSLTIPFQ